jgi:hypothetical protein
MCPVERLLIAPGRSQAASAEDRADSVEGHVNLATLFPQDVYESAPFTYVRLPFSARSC